MVEDKVGKKPYLGIVIDYDKEKKLDKFSLDTLKDRYFWEEETHAQEAFARASVFGATYKGETERLVAYLLAAFLTMYLTVGVVYLIIMMKTYGSLVQVEASVDIGEMLEAMVLVLLTILVLLDQSHSCMS